MKATKGREKVAGDARTQGYQTVYNRNISHIKNISVQLEAWRCLIENFRCAMQQNQWQKRGFHAPRYHSTGSRGVVSFVSGNQGYFKLHSRSVQSSAAMKKARKEQDTYYKLKIHTGDLRGAGTSEPVYVRLHGENGSSDQIPLHVELQRAMAVEAIMKVQGDLGILERMEV
eukprot:692165-Hanusia_phi.AAC.1